MVSKEMRPGLMIIDFEVQVFGCVDAQVQSEHVLPSRPSLWQPTIARRSKQNTAYQGSLHSCPGADRIDVTVGCVLCLFLRVVYLHFLLSLSRVHFSVA